jgi:hypothetical protein
MDNLINNIKISTAVSDDADEIKMLVNSVYRGENSKKGWTTEAYFLDGIRITPEKVKEIIDKNNNVILTFTLNNKIIGCVHLEEKDDTCWLGMLSVDVNYQTNGLGKFIIEKSEDYSVNIFECNEMKMKVIGIRDELINYYLRRGYVLTGETEDFNTSKDVFGKPNQTDLCFKILKKQLYTPHQ